MSRPEAGFVQEADMLAALAPACVLLSQQRLPGGRWSALFEVPAGNGIADVCAVRFSPRHAAVREGRPAITEWTDVRAFAKLQHAGPQIEVNALAAAVGMTVPGLRRGPARRLVTGGHVRWVGERSLRPEWRYSVPITGVVAVEAKLADWRRALVQARRHTDFADASYVALPPAAAERAAAARAIVESAQVGIMAVKPAGDVRVLVEAPTPRRSAGWALRRMFAAEQLWAVHATGAISGPVRPVFGRPAPTSALDPRVPAVGPR